MSTYQLGDLSKLFSGEKLQIPDENIHEHNEKIFESVNKEFGVENNSMEVEEDVENKKPTKKTITLKERKKSEKNNEQKEEENPKKRKQQPTNNDQQNKLERKKIKMEDKLELFENTMFISNFPIPLEDTHLKESKKLVKKLFSAYGTIDSIRFRSLSYEKSKISTQKNSFLSRKRDKDYGNVYIKFEKELTNEVKQQMIDDLNGKVLFERHIQVDDANHTKPTQEENEKSVFIQNLPFEIDVEDIWNTFGKKYEIFKIRLIRDRVTNKCKGYGYIQFKTKEEVKKVLDRNPKYKFEGREVEVVPCQQEKKKKKKNKEKDNNKKENNKINNNKTDKKNIEKKSSEKKTGEKKRIEKKTEKKTEEKKVEKKEDNKATKKPQIKIHKKKTEIKKQ
ncbi:hypothetical protein ABK040_010173 [Willaertia magna]